MSASTVRELAEVLWRAEKDAQPHSVAYADTYDAEPSEYRRIVLTQAHAILASPTLDAIVAERIAALAEDEAALSAVWDAMESHGHNGVECRPEKPMDYTAVYVIHALAAVLTERRSSDG